MSFYQEPVRDFLHAKRSVFVSPECKIQLFAGKQTKDTYWYCDIITIDLQANAVYLCEVTYSKTLAALLKRLNSWDSNWAGIKSALIRDCGIDPEWDVVPWVFFPSSHFETFSKKHAPKQMPKARVTFLESVTPWTYPEEARTDDRIEIYNT